MLRPLPAWRWRAECSVISEKTPALIGADRATPGKDSANWVGDSELEEDDWLRGFMSLCVRVRLCWNWSCIIYYTYLLFIHISIYLVSHIHLLFFCLVQKQLLSLPLHVALAPFPQCLMATFHMFVKSVLVIGGGQKDEGAGVVCSSAIWRLRGTTDQSGYASITVSHIRTTSHSIGHMDVIWYRKQTLTNNHEIMAC